MADPYINVSGNVLATELSQVDKDLEVYREVRSKLDPNDTDNIQVLDQTISELEIKKSQIQTAFANKTEECFVNNQDIGWMRENIELCKSFLTSEQYAYWKEVISTEMTGVDPCGSTTMAGISKALKKLFTFLKSIKKYYNAYVQPVLNTIAGVTETISNISRLIVGIIRILIQRARNWLIQKIKNLMNDAFSSLFPNLAKKIKDAVVKLITDSIFCKFGEIIRGLGQLVSDFLFSLIGNLINAPFCAAEQFANSLINNIGNRIDKALEPILNQINSILGGVGRIAGSIFEAIDFILGFESFLCSAGPECPELKSFRTSWWGGPPQEAADRFQNFLGGLNLSSGETSDLLNQFDRWVGDFGIFKGSGNEIDSQVSTLVSQFECNTGAFACGPPQVQIFGGGGVGAVGKAIVNQIGQVVGVDLLNRGVGYTSPPYVSFVDNCGNGNYASGYAVLDDGNNVNNVNNGNNNIPLDPITFAPIGDSEIPNLEETSQGYTGTNAEGKCAYGARVYHEFDNERNVTIGSEISSNIDIEFQGREAPDRLITDLSSDEKHYSVKFVVPYDNDNYEINFTKVAQIAAHGGGGGEFKVAGIKNKTRNGFDVWFGRTAVVNRAQSKSTSSKTYTRIPVYRYYNPTTRDFFCDVKSPPPGYTVNEGILCYVFSEQPPNTQQIVDNDDDDFSNAGRPYSGVMGYAYNKIKPKDNQDVIPIYALGNGNDTMWSTKKSEGQYKFLRVEFWAPTSDLSFTNSFDTNSTTSTAPGRPERFEPKVSLEYAPEGQLFNTYVRFFEFSTVGERSNCSPGSPLRNIVITNPGNGYLPGPNGQNEFGDPVQPEFSDDTREYVGCLSEIQVISTGIGYSPEDSITIEPNIPDLEVRVRLTELGQIVQMDILNTSCGLNQIPEITINTKTGGGASFRPIIQFTPKDQFTSAPVRDSDIVRVIDCVLK